MDTLKDDWSGPAPVCDSCGGPMTRAAQEHSDEGFGHHGVCCVCYEIRMRGGGRGKRSSMRARLFPRWWGDMAPGLGILAGLLVILTGAIIGSC